MGDVSKYYYEYAGQQMGPVAANQLVARGVTASTLVWREGMSDWAAAETVPALRDLFAPPQPVSSRPAAPTRAQPVRPTRPGMPPPSPARSVFTRKNLLMGLVVLVAIGAEVASRAEPDAAEPERTEQQNDAPAQEEEVKEIGYAAKHLHDEDASEDRVEAQTEESAASESATYYWYGCAFCGKLITAHKEPGFSRCPAKTGISGTEHTWEKLGAVGDKQYTCYFCAASISTDVRPEPGKCLMSPNKGGISGLGHQWEESGVSINRM
jgi:hypothetical protein